MDDIYLGFVELSELSQFHLLAFTSVCSPRENSMTLTAILNARYTGDVTASDPMSHSLAIIKRAMVSKNLGQRPYFSKVITA
jgi:hypothetical protein